MTTSDGASRQPRDLARRAAGHPHLDEQLDGTTTGAAAEALRLASALARALDESMDRIPLVGVPAPLDPAPTPVPGYAPLPPATMADATHDASPDAAGEVEPGAVVALAAAAVLTRPPTTDRSAPPAPRVVTLTSGDWTVVRLWGEVDAACLDDARGALAALAALAAAGGRAPVLVDARDVASMDSTGVALLERVRSTCHATGASVALVDPSPAVSAVLAIVGADRAMPVLSVGGSRS